MHCPGGNATDLIWKVLASSDRISSWTLLKPQHSNPNPNPLAKQLWSIDFLTPPTPLIIPHRLRAFLESLRPLKNWYSIHARWSKSSLKHSNCCCSCSFEAEIIKHNEFSRVYDNFKCLYKKKSLETYWKHHVSWYCSTFLCTEFCKDFAI